MNFKIKDRGSSFLTFILYLLAILDTLVTIGTLILPAQISIVIVIILFVINIVVKRRRKLMKNNKGVVAVDYVGKPSYLFLLEY